MEKIHLDATRYRRAARLLLAIIRKRSFLNFGRGEGGDIIRAEGANHPSDHPGYGVL